MPSSGKMRKKRSEFTCSLEGKKIRRPDQCPKQSWKKKVVQIVFGKKSLETVNSADG